MPRVTRILNPSKRSGSSDKGPWNIMEVEVEKEDGSLVKADTFDTVVDGDMVELEPNNYTNPSTGKTYHGWNARIPRQKKPAAGGGTDLTPVMEAVRMVFKEVKEANRKLDLLIGPPEGPSEPNSPEAAEEEAAGPTRDWQSVGRGGSESTPPEPTVEPVPEPPEDLESFMNG